MKLKTNLFLLNALIVTVAIGFGTSIFLAQMQTSAITQANLQQEEAIQTFWQLLRDKGGDLRISNGRLQVGGYLLNGNCEIPDKIQKIFGGTATIFMGDTRVATNVLKQDGSRALNTKLQGPAYDAVFRENRSYRGEAPILGISYVTAYDPIRDRSGKTIGALYVGIKKGEVLTALNRLKLQLITGNAVIDVMLLSLALILLWERDRHDETLKKSEESLRRMADHLRLITDSVPVLIAYLDLDRRYRFVNSRYEEWFELDREKIIGRSIEEVHGAAIFEAMQPHIETVLKGEEVTFLAEIEQNGKPLFLQVSYLPHRLGSDEVVGFFALGTDVTASRVAEQSLRSSEERYRTMFDTTGTATFIIEEDATVSLVNDEFAGLSGYAREEVEGKLDFMKLVSYQYREQMLDYHRKRRQGSTSVPSVYECDTLRKDGTLRRTRVHTRLIPGTGQSVVSFLDITEYKELQEALRNQLEFLQTLIDTIPSPIFYKDKQGRYLGHNLAFEKYLGLSRDELIGKTVFDIAPPDLAEKYLTMDRELLANPGVQVYESSVLYADGSRHEVVFNKATYTEKDGQVGGMVGVILDVTYLKQAERLLAGEKAALELIVKDAALEEVLNLLCKNVEDQAFEALCSVLLLDESGIQLRHAAAPSLPPEYNQAIDGTRVGLNIGSCGTAAFLGEEVIASDIATDPRWAKYKKLPLSYGLKASYSRPIMSSVGKILGTFAVYYRKSRSPNPADLLLLERAASLASIVIERKRSAEALRQIQLHQRAILDNIPDLVWLKNRDSKFITVNKAFAAAGGMTPEELIGQSDSDIWAKELAEKYRRDDLVVMASGVQTRVEEMLATRFGAPRWIETIKTPVYDRHGELIGTTGVARDIMARKRTEMALQESEERFHTIFDQSDDAIILFTLCNIEVMDANPAALQLFGYGRDELLAQPPDRLIAREAFERLIGEMRENEAANTFQIDAHGMRRDGEQLSIVIRARILRLREEYVVHCSIRDIGEKLRLEEEIRATQAKLIQTNKMTSLGMLSSSVAHEINNPNNCISVNASMLSEVWRDTDTILKRFHAQNGDFNLRGVPYHQMQQVVPRLFNGVIEGSRRIGMIINNMKDFVREDKRGHDRDLDINKLIQSAASILWHKIHKYTENFVMDLDEELLPARGNAQQIEQVIINLLMNALQALPDMDKGVCVRTACDRGSGEIVITVRDEGEGMAENVMARLREPFFSTRLDKGGTGLGLYISDSIIKEHKGTLEFASELRKGTVATIRLPVT